MSTTNPQALNHETLSPGQMLGRYELLLPIATGGMGSVWAARLKGTRGFRKLVALKTILHSFEDARLEQMLFQEANLASQIHHPNVVETIELGEDRGVMYLVMELIHGESLSYILREAFAHGSIPLPVAVNLMGQVCKGLQAAHDLCDSDGRRVGLVHRDISPPNVLVTYAGSVKIVDFGVATTSSSVTLGSGEIKGKISYLAPEQLRGDAIDARVDVFTAGILLYLLTTGRHPFKAATEPQTISRILDGKPAAPPSSFVEGYPAELEAVVLRAVDKDRDMRFQSAAEFLDALEAAVPDAFGAHSEKVVADYVHELLRSRIVERRAMLRMAEELAENSSSRDSAVSVGMVTPLRPGARRPRKWPLAAGMAVVATAALAVAAFQKPQARTSGDAVQATLRPAPAPAQPPVATGLHALRPEAPSKPRVDRAPAAPPAVTDAEVTASVLVERRAAKPAAAAPDRSDTTAFLDSAPEDNAESAEVGSGLVTDVVEAPTAAIEPAPSVPAVAPANVPALSPARAARDLGPRQLSSKVAHARLATNPSAYRVKLPPALERSGQSFNATVRICVSPEGKVTAVNVLKSAGAAIDKQIPSVLGKWRYRPLVEDGRALPFCYPLKYEVTGR